MLNPQFRDDVITGIVSYCTRNHILPSASEIGLTYQTTEAGSPLRHFMAYWTLTHKHASPLSPAAIPAAPALRAAFAADLATERALRTASVNEDLATTADAHHHPRLYADERFAGDQALGGGAGAAPFYGDDVCRLHVAHAYGGYRRPLANADRDVDGGAGGAALDVEGDPAARLLGFSTRVEESEGGMRSTAATGWVNPANDVQAQNGVRNPCRGLLRKRNCYGAVVVGYRPKASEVAHEEMQRGEDDGAQEDKGEGAAAEEADLPPAIADDPDMLAILEEAESQRVACQDRLKQQSALTAQIVENEHRPSDSAGPTPYVSPTEPFFTGGFPQPQPTNVPGVGGRPDVTVNPVAAFNALRLPVGWQQRRCVDGRAYFVRFVPGMAKEVTWVDPRDAVVWHRSDELLYVKGMGWGFEEGTETEKGTDSEGYFSSEEAAGGEQEVGGGGDDHVE